MKIAFWAVGKHHEDYVKSGVEEFSGRIGNYFKLEWELIPVPKEAAQLQPKELKKKEAELILSKIAKEDYLVALEERGRQMTSEGLAAFLQHRANAGTRRIIFLIGGAFGLDETVHRRANTLWSLSQLVFPHQLVRLILAEQVYRACTILKNEKYHHS
ncbi:23S rRNA (pseudouridine(1915)-N(3))-methyltransferase RlmH [Niabella ginsenosidivorans]|uniref:Ribosomal RNA large subunit methyltransferase H n=1 Tax=Niabella ginsenosidivorans TaxID=1176587 RepID=A0A1A9IBH4_9BACT|nr:23S rRNA (pseudouridine(1915)-N(3))-methyltransferase RlmH [Niabella ginsenosidivorans]ANH83914.1 23S rRNA (pseudouridine(1915)-N(3))-methyltransferase RlmH [Niabella ginsenosidivorans]